MEKSTAIQITQVPKTPEQLYAERERRMHEAIQLRQPDRIPMMLPISYMLAEIGGITQTGVT